MPTEPNPTTLSAPEIICRLVTEKRGRMTYRKSDRARVTVWYPNGPITGSWSPPNLAQFAAAYYEYEIGVPTTVEYAR